MANLMVANVCNLNCPYCFAAIYMKHASPGKKTAFISPETFDHHLDFLERSQIRQARLIGGEPTLHPQLPQLIHQAQQRGFEILLFSHGFIPERVLACLEVLSPDVCTVLINMNAAQTGRAIHEDALARRQAAILRLGAKARLGYNLYQPNFTLDPLLPIIQQTKCQPAIRLGLAQPILAGENAYLPPKLYPLVGQKIARFARRAAAENVTLEFDCGFVRCMFSPADLETLKHTGADVGWRCNPILDISMDGRAIHCFPLTGRVETAVPPHTSAAALRQQLGNQTKAYRTAGIYRECSRCHWKQTGACSGGCLAHTMRRFRHRTLHFRIPVPKLDRVDQV